MKKTKIFAVILAAIMSASVMPQTTQLPTLSVTAYAASKLPAPKNIKATAGKTKVTLKWSAVDGADGYIVYKYNSSTKKYKQYKKVTGTTCTVKNLKQGTKYKFKVAAYVKKNGKTVIQTKSKVISATTKSKQAQINLDDFVIEDGVLREYVGKGGDVVIPDSVTAVDGFAFAGRDSLTNITFPKSVTYIAAYAFYGCTSLKTVTIPKNVTSIGWFAFGDCTALTSVTIPDSFTAIEFGAFYGCTSLKSVTIPNSVTGIGANAFFGCTSLTSVTIPNGVTFIGECAFDDCSSIKVTYKDKTYNYDNLDDLYNAING